MYGTMLNYPLTLNIILEHIRNIHGDKRVHTLLSKGKIHTNNYSKFCHRVGKLANAIRELGIQHGDRVAVFASNTYQHLELFFAIPAAGGVIHPINVRLSSEQQRKTVQHANDILFFIDNLLIDAFSDLHEKVKIPKSIHFNTDVINGSVEYLHDYEDLIAEVQDDCIPDTQEENSVLALCYTSGTSGEPKGVLYTHRSVFLHTLAVNQTEVFGIMESDVVMPLVPMYHALAWGIPFAAMFVGADIVLHGTDYDDVVDLIIETGVTISAGAPTIWRRLLPEFQRRKQDISSLRQIIVGGEAMPSSLIDVYENELGVEVRHAWGMTEMCPTGTFSTLRRVHQYLPEKEKIRIKSMQGRPIPGVQIRLATEDGSILPCDGETIGEVQVRSPWTVGKYYKSEAFTDCFTKDGWLRTGDLATINHEGYMQITDRAKAIIKSGGESIATAALERVLLQHTSVLEAAVIGIPDEKWGERPIAVVVLTDNTFENISIILSEHLAVEFPRFWIPDDFIIIDEIPKNGVGKTDKNAIMHIVTKQKQ